MDSYLPKQTINLGEYSAAYAVLGEGEPIIFLHGFFGDGWTLRPIMEQLLSNYCCIGLDLLGFGDSSKPNIRYFIDHQVGFLKTFLVQKQIQKFHLVGYSYGAWVAAAYAISLFNSNSNNGEDLNKNKQDIENLQGITLIAPAGIRDDSFVGRYNHLKPLLWDTKLVDITLASIAPLFELISQGKYFASIRQARMAITQQPAAKSFMCDRLKPEDAVDTVENQIHCINTPTLVIAGGADRHIPLWHSQTYAERIPNAKLEIIPGADHDLVQTHSREISCLLQQSLKLKIESRESGVGNG